jgi:hypothetical protein
MVVDNIVVEAKSAFGTGQVEGLDHTLENGSVGDKGLISDRSHAIFRKLRQLVQRFRDAGPPLVGI